MKIFITDDDLVLRLVIREHLNQAGREIVEFTHGEALLAAIDQAPDLILLDIEMPGMDGLATCRAWRAAETQYSQIIFISSHDTLEMRLAAYDAGGNDYLEKPIHAPELERKIKVAEQFLSQQRQLAEQAQFAGKTAFTALSSLGEMGVLRQFMHAAFTAQSSSELVSMVFEVIGQYGLTGLIAAKSNVETLFFSSHGNCNALEISLLSQSAQLGHVLQLRDRLIINYPNITLLLKGFPFNNEELAGRLRDNLAILAEAAHIKLHSLAIEHRQQRPEVSHILATLAEALDDVQCNLAVNRLRVAEINIQLLNQQIDTLKQLSIDDTLKQSAIDETRMAHQQLSSLRNVDESIAEQLRSVAGQLYRLAHTAPKEHS